MTKFDPTKPVQTRGNSRAGIYSTDNGGNFPIHGWVARPDGSRTMVAWTSGGRYTISGFDTPSDLINIPAEPITIKAWATVRGDGAVFGLFQKRPTDPDIGEQGIALVPLTGTFTPGEGLSDG